MNLTFVVNGEEVRLTPDLTQPLQEAVQEALARSQNMMRPYSDWELRYESGVHIPDQTQWVGTYGFTEGSTLFLTLRVGVGG